MIITVFEMLITQKKMGLMHKDIYCLNMIKTTCKISKSFIDLVIDFTLILI